MPANYAFSKVTGKVDLFLATGFIAWGIVAGALLVATASRCAYWMLSVRPMQRGHLVFAVLTFFMLISYALVAMEPFRRSSFFLLLE
jgi:hypothetical protein